MFNKALTFFLVVVLINLLACGGESENEETATVNQPPVVSLLGSELISLKHNQAFNDPGATATDAEDGNLTSSIIVTSNFDASVAGNYLFVYSVADSSGANHSANRDVTVADNIKPVLTLIGNAIDTVKFGESYVDLGVSAVDDEDGDISSSVRVETTLNTRFPGHYQINYQVTDSAGSDAVLVTRQVTVEKASIESSEDAFRFLQRATFGPTIADVTQLTQQGYEAWLDQQIAMNMSLHLPNLRTRMARHDYPLDSISAIADGSSLLRLLRDAWFDLALNSEDQLRHRVAFALGQILVISSEPGDLRHRAQGLANYNDILIKNAFGNFKNLLKEVTLNPMMGHYLSMRRNRKANIAQGTSPDENYAREVMQLFSLGLVLLNQDGTPKLDENNQQIPAYTQENILNFARVFTGWNYGNYDRFWGSPRTLESELLPMKGFDEQHDKDEKTLLLGATIPSGRSVTYEMEFAIDNLFHHPNVGPFIGKQLITKLVTSNPSTEYVARVAAVFADNGNGVRGDLGATVRAILMDPDALLGHQETPLVFGKLKEPLLKFTALWRAFDAVGADPNRIRFTHTLATLGQEVLRAPSVFNFFSPDFSKPGAIRDQNLVSPEFQILGESRAINMHNQLRRLARSSPYQADGVNSTKNRVILDIEDEKLLASDASALVDHLINKLIGEPISEITRSIIIDRVSLISNSDSNAENRVDEAIYMIIVSPEFAVQR